MEQQPPVVAVDASVDDADKKNQSNEPIDDDTAAKTVTSTPIERPSIATRLSLHSPSSNIIGTPFPSGDQPFEYPFPDTSPSSSPSSSRIPSSEHFSSPYQSSADTTGPAPQDTTSPSAALRRHLDSKKVGSNLKLRPNNIADTPVPPSLAGKRHLFDLDLGARRGTQNSRTGESSPDAKASSSAAGRSTVQPRDNDPGNNVSTTGSAADPRDGQKSA